MSETSAGTNEKKEEMDPFEKLLIALGNSMRVLILKKIARFPQTETDKGGIYPGDLADHLQITKQGVMKHLKILKDGGLVEEYSREALNPGPQRIYYRLTPIARDLLEVLEKHEASKENAPEEIFQVRQKLEHMEGPAEMREIAILEGDLVGIEEQLTSLDHERQELLQKRLEIVQKIRGLTDQIIEQRFGELLAQGGASIDEFSIEREILHTFFDNPIQAFVRGFDLNDLLKNTLAPTSKNTAYKRGKWEQRILEFLEDLDIIKLDKTGKRYFFYM